MTQLSQRQARTQALPLFPIPQMKYSLGEGTYHQRPYYNDQILGLPKPHELHVASPQTGIGPCPHCPIPAGIRLCTTVHTRSNAWGYNPCGSADQITWCWGIDLVCRPVAEHPCWKPPRSKRIVRFRLRALFSIFIIQEPIWVAWELRAKNRLESL